MALGIGAVAYALYPTSSSSGDAPTSRAWPYRHPVGRPTDIESEIAFYQKRVREHPNDGPGNSLLAEACLRQARLTHDPSWFLRAEEAARASLAHQPVDNAGAATALASVAEARHDFAAALALLDGTPRREATLGLRVTCLLALGRLDEAAVAAEALVARAPSTASYTRLALVDIAQGRDEAAVADFRRALRREEAGDRQSSAFARAMFGRFYQRRGRRALARDLYDEALRIIPDDPLALALRAELEASEGRYEAADDDYKKAITQSQNPAWQLARAGVCDARGNAAEAQALRDSARAELERQSSGAAFGHRRDLARFLLDRGATGDAARALELMRTEAGLRADADTLDLLARALLANDQAAAARDAEMRALHWGLRDAEMQLRLAQIEETLNHPEAARTARAEAARINPLATAPR